MAEPRRVIRNPPQRGRQRRWVFIIGAVFLLLISLGSVVRFYTDLLWFRELRLGQVFWLTFLTRIGVGFAGGLGAAIVLLINLEVARRAAPRYRFGGPATDAAEHYRAMFRPYARWANVAVAALVGLLTGASTSVQWERILLWRNAQPFGTKDPLFGRDVSFFVFGVPFQRTILSWCFGVIVVSLLLSIVAHVLHGSVEPQANRIEVRPLVKVHVSVLLGVLAVLKAWGYVLAQYDLVISPRGTVTGASYTDVHAQLPALKLLTIIALVAAVIFLLNFRFRGWLLPGAAIALWAFSSIVIGAIIPWSVQRFTVEPNEARRERPFIRRNIEATRAAFELDRIKPKSFAADFTLTDRTIAENRDTVDNLRVWDPETLKKSYDRQQAIRTYYEFRDVDIDRYIVDGRMRQIMLAPREVDPSELVPSARTWVNTYLAYTHGYGVVATPANSVTPEGKPEFIVRDLPPIGPEGLVPTEPRIYYGEEIHDFAIVGTKTNEIDYPIEGGNVRSTYKGQGGIALTGPLRRLAFAWRFSDTNLLISSQITPRSRLMMRRDIRERAHTAAPFLRFDHDPYAIVADGRVYWVLDAYTGTDRYPYSQEVALEEIFVPVFGAPVQQGVVNYLRNSVKVVIDAYDGTMRFYVVQPGDGIIATYQRIFPTLFTPNDQMPDAIRAHLRYPEDLFLVQADRLRLYHVTDPLRLYEKEDVWEFPKDAEQSSETLTRFIEPYYVVMKLPGETDPEFLLMQPFTPAKKPNLNGWIAARADPKHYGEIVEFTFPQGAAIDGPENVHARIEQDPVVSQQITFWDQAGSRVLRGNLLVIPIGTSLIYVRPIYLEAQQSPIPELRRVVVVYGDNVAFEPTLEEALAKAIAGRPSQAVPEEPPRPPTGEPTPAAPTGDVASLLDQAADHFTRADEALRRGDLAAYQRENEAARRAVAEARRRSRGG